MITLKENLDLKGQTAQLDIDLQPNEEIFEFTPKHWTSILWPIVVLILIMFITFFALILTTFFPLSNFSIQTIYIALLGLGYIAIIIYSFSEWYGYRHSALIVTNQRIIDCEQVNFWSRRVQTIDIHEIQSCSGNLDSGLGAILNYGHVCVNTIGDKSIIIHNIPNPEAASTLIMNHHNSVAHGSKK